ncbi:MAG: polyphosphate kinase 2 family protein [Candidatus Binatales bacterium]
MSKPDPLINPFRIDDGSGFRLKDHDPRATAHLKSSKHAEEFLARGITKLSALQEKLYAQDSWALLVIFQAMDAAGKDSAIKHVMSGVNPQGCEVFSFKQPSSDDLEHDFLWRTSCRLPERGRIGIFNRSYYEEVLVVRVHKELLENERLPKQLVTKDIWKERFENINAFERHLTRNGIVMLKFFLNVSKQEQKKRFLDRLEMPAKSWKFSVSDVKERERWDEYMEAYEDLIRHTATRHAPWYVVPADHKWFTRIVVAEAIVSALEDLKLELPKIDSAKRKELKAARAALEAEAD